MKKELIEISSVKTMSSLEIAELTGKNHDKVMIDIKSMLDELEIGHADFRDSYKSLQNKNLICYNLPRRECDILISGYSIKYRTAIIDRWQELELQQALPSTKLEWMKLAVELEEVNQANLLKIEQDKPKVDFALAIKHTDGKVSVGDFAKVLGFGRNRLFKMMRDDKILMSNNIPYQNYQERKYFDVSESMSKPDRNGNTFPLFITSVTGMGQIFLHKKYRAV